MSESESGSDASYEYVSDSSSVEFEDDGEGSEREDVPWSPSLGGEAVHTRVVQLVSSSCCGKYCLRGKEKSVEKLVNSLNMMSKEARRTSMLTAVANSSGAVGTIRQRGDGERDRYVYLLPFCGEVCKEAFVNAYELSDWSLKTARQQVRRGEAFVCGHKNVKNKNAVSLDHDHAVNWFRGFASVVGEVVPIRFRRQRKQNGVVERYVTRESFTLLPSNFTWEKLYTEYQAYCETQAVTAAFPSCNSFYKILKRRCRDIRIRSPRSNVCDVCAIYRNVSSRNPTAEEMESLGVHALDARVMRHQYSKDAGLATGFHYVSTIDYAQNLALPHVESTPSSWYFLSLIWVSLFGIHSQNTKQQYNYVYSERTAGKGSNEVISMLHHHALSEGFFSADSVWTIYADNCGGQNKNGHLLRYLLLLVDSGRLKRANLYFLVKGHTKNHCDGGFGLVKRAYAKRDLYTISQVTDVVEASATTNKAICVEDQQGVFKDWEALQSVYRDVKGIQKFQLFSIDSSSPGVVMCRKRPSSEPVCQDLRKRGCVPTSPEGWATVWSSIEQLQAPIANPEKVSNLHKKILPFIPEEFRSNPLYRAPTPDEIETAKSRKRRRLHSTPTLVDRMQRRLDSTSRLVDRVLQTEDEQKTGV